MPLISRHIYRASSEPLINHKSCPAIGGELFSSSHLFRGPKKKVNQRWGWVKMDLGLGSSSLRRILLVVSLTSLETFILSHCLCLVSPSSARRSRAWVSVVAFFLACAVCVSWLITLLGRDRETSVPTSTTTGWGPTSRYELEAAFQICSFLPLWLCFLKELSNHSFLSLGDILKPVGVNWGWGTCLQLFEDAYLFILVS